LAKFAGEPETAPVRINGGERGFSFRAITEPYSRSSGRDTVGNSIHVVAEEGAVVFREERGRRFELASILVDRCATQEREVNVAHTSCMGALAAWSEGRSRDIWDTRRGERSCCCLNRSTCSDARVVRAPAGDGASC